MVEGSVISGECWQTVGFNLDLGSDKNKVSNVVPGIVRELVGHHCLRQDGPKSCEQKLQVANFTFLKLSRRKLGSELLEAKPRRTSKAPSSNCPGGVWGKAAEDSEASVSMFRCRNVV